MKDDRKERRNDGRKGRRKDAWKKECRKEVGRELMKKEKVDSSMDLWMAEQMWGRKEEKKETGIKDKRLKEGKVMIGLVNELTNGQIDLMD